MTLLPLCASMLLQVENSQIYESVVAGNLTNAGAAIATLNSGKKAFILGALPSEIVDFKVLSEKSKYCEGEVVKIIKSSERRIPPLNPETYLSTSPWQIIDIDYEEEIKKDLTLQSFRHAFKHYSENDLILRDIDDKISYYSSKKNNLPEYYYRNKIIYYFFNANQCDTESLDYQLGIIQNKSHQILEEKNGALANKKINTFANRIIEILKSNQVQYKHLNNLLVRISKNCDIVAQLSVNYSNCNFWKSIFENQDLNISVVENSKSGSRIKKIYQTGVDYLIDTINIKNSLEFKYSVNSFWQVNTIAYEATLREISQFVADSIHILDLYCGVGSISLNTISSGAKSLKLVEINKESVKYCRKNVEMFKKYQNSSKIRIDVILSDASRSIDHITSEKTLILDPPRAGLNKGICEKINQNLPEKICYLSCDISTLVRDIGMIIDNYQIKKVIGYNYFPKTPHLETLVLLKRKSS